MKKILTIAIVLASMMYASSASALGDKEKNVLAFLGGVFMVDKIADHYSRKQNAKMHNPHFDQAAREVEQAYLDGVAQREREIALIERQKLEERKRRAYRCGYEGICE